jgi:hypothetical protein
LNPPSQRFRKRALRKEEIDRLLAAQRATKHHSWLNTKNRKRVLEAIDKKQKTVKLEGVSWELFKLKYSPDGTKVYVSPTGTSRTVPFGPSIWLEIDRLRVEVADNG